MQPGSLIGIQPRPGWKRLVAPLHLQVQPTSIDRISRGAAAAGFGMGSARRCVRVGRTPAHTGRQPFGEGRLNELPRSRGGNLTPDRRPSGSATSRYSAPGCRLPATSQVDEPRYPSVNGCPRRPAREGGGLEVRRSVAREISPARSCRRLRRCRRNRGGTGCVRTRTRFAPLPGGRNLQAHVVVGAEGYAGCAAPAGRAWKAATAATVSKVRSVRPMRKGAFFVPGMVWPPPLTVYRETGWRPGWR